MLEDIRSLAVSLVASTVLSFVLVGNASAALISILASDFSLGDNLATVNAVTTPLGVTFDAEAPGSFLVVLDGNGNSAFSASVVDFQNIDMLINLSSGASSVTVTFGRNADTVSSGIDVFSQLQTPFPPFFGVLFQDGDFIDDRTVFSYTIPSPPLIGVPIRSVFFQQNPGIIGGPPEVTYVRRIDIEFVDVPEPSSLWLAMVGLGWFARRRVLRGHNT